MIKLIQIKIPGVFLLCLMVVFTWGCAFAQGSINPQASQLFEQGNANYSQAKYDLAIDSYSQILNLGLESGNLYYNLGNSYFKKGDLGRAVLYYEKALILTPNDSDLKSNYEYVLSLLNLGHEFFGNRLIKAVHNLFADVSVNFLTAFLSLLWVLALLILTFSFIFAGARKTAKIALIGLCAVGMITIIALNGKITYLAKGAVVVTSEAEVKFEPLEGATTYFKLNPGNKVEVLEKAKDWYKIKRPDGKLGWIEKTKLGVISSDSP